MLVNPSITRYEPVGAADAQTSRFERILRWARNCWWLRQPAAGVSDPLLDLGTQCRRDRHGTGGASGIRIIGITALAYTHGVTSRHPSGHKLADLCDIVIDNCAPYGDAVVEIPGCPQKIGPLSTLTGVAVVNALVAETVARLVAADVVPPVFMSANVDGGDAHNAAQLKANAHRIHYMN